MERLRNLFSRLSSYLFYGFVFWLPLVLIIYIVAFLFHDLDTVGRDVLDIAIPERFLFSGSGFIMCLLIIYFSGVVLKRPGPARALSRIPVIGPFFAQGNVMSLDRLAHLAPCLFLFSPTCISYGWILSEEKVKSPNKDETFTIINVYYPNVPTLVTGQVFAARKETVMKLANSSTEVIYLLLYAFRSPVSLQYVPWEDESNTDFEKRAGNFGLNIVNNSPAAGRRATIK